MSDLNQFDEDVDDEALDVIPHSFSVINGGAMFGAAPATVSAIKPGIYRMQFGMGMAPLWVPHELKTDQLIELGGDSQIEEIVRDIASFWNSAHLYEMYGMVHKRGYLLHGPQGTGKSSLLMLVAHRVVKAGGIVFIPPNPSRMSLSLKAFRELSPKIPIMCLCEELSHFMAGDEDAMLSLLDGEDSVDNVVYMATTNYVHQLADNIRNRPGRFDRVVKVDQPSIEVRREYALRILQRDTRMDQAARIELATRIAEVGLLKHTSIAHTKEMIVATRILGEKLEDVVERMTVETVTDDADE